MKNMEDFREEEVGSRMGDGVTPATAHMDNVLRSIRDYARTPSTSQPVITSSSSPSPSNSYKECNLLEFPMKTAMLIS